MDNKKLTFTDFVRIYIRSFFIQAVWNYQNLLATGFCYALVPVAKRLFESKEQRVSFLKRHMDFFNAHPYFALFAIGAIAKIEESGTSSPEKISHFKNALMGPLGAVGDKLVWATIKPASILFGLVGVIILDDLEWKIVFLMIVLTLYNIPHLVIRGYGLYKGYSMGYGVYKILNINNFKVINNWYGGLGATLLGIYISYSSLEFASGAITDGALFLSGSVIVFWLRKWGIPFFYSIILPIIVVIISGILIGKI